MVKYRLIRKCKSCFKKHDCSKKSNQFTSKFIGKKTKKQKNNKPKNNKSTKNNNPAKKVKSNKLNTNPFIYNRESIPQVERNLVCYNQNWKCNLCDKMFKCSIIIDHIRPLFLGGNNTLTNYQGLCDVCNKIKTDIIDKKLDKEFSSGKLKESDMTTSYILDKQLNYYDSKDYYSYN